MKRHKNTERLHQLMVEFKLDGPTVAKLLNRSLKTVHCWRSQSPAPIPTHQIELLEFKLRETL